MSTNRFFLTGFLLVLFCHQLCAQDYYFRHYQVENGLSNNAVVSCLQDKKGFLWFGTKDGLNRFDGYTFKVFRNIPTDSGSIGSNFIHCLYEDGNGILWIGTERGLYSYNETTERFSLLQQTLNAPIREVMMDRSGYLWYINGFSLTRLNRKENTLVVFDVGQYFEATSMCTAPDGVVWVSTSTGMLQQYHPTSGKFTAFPVFNEPYPSISNWIEKIYCTSNGSILIGTATGAKIFNRNTGDRKDLLSSAPNAAGIFVRNFLETAANEYWIASESGIYICNAATLQVNHLQKMYNDPYSISDNAVYAFCKDREGGIWASTYFGGMNYFPRQFAHFRKWFPQTGENSLSGNVVREIQEDNYGNVWIGTEDAGLNKYHIATGKFTSYQPTGKKTGLSYSNIHGLLVHGNELWIGTFEHGLDVMNIATGQVVKHYNAGEGPGDMRSNFIYCISKTKENEILLGTTRGAYKYRSTTNDFAPLEGMPLNNWYSYIYKDSRGIIWAATYGNGINFFHILSGESGNFRHNPALLHSLASDRVNSIFEDSNRNLWFATENGLCKYDTARQHFKTYTTENGFPSNFILSMLEDSRQNIWLSTSKGMVCFDPRTEKIETYTRINGILNDQFNFNSAFKDKSGQMYFGSVKGLTSFNPDAFSRNTFVPPVYITNFQIFNKDLTIGSNGSPLKKSITYTGEIQLAYNQSTISIDFAALSYTAPDMVEYAYKMEGLDEDWTFLKRNRKVYFTELAPGTYVFKVKASNGSGVWNDRETNLRIEILPSWWTSKWAYACYTLLLMGLVWYGIVLYHRSIEERNRRKFELLEIAKEKEIFKAKIEFFTNVAHEIKTPLTLIKGPLEKVIRKSEGIPGIQQNLAIMDRNTNRLIDLTNQLLDFRQTEIQGFGLSFVKANISQLLRETYLSFQPLAEQKNMSIQLRMPKPVLYAFIDLDAFNKILNNLFSNAIKYAEKKVLIVLLPFGEEDRFFTIEIKNDGFLIPFDMKEKIFEPFFRLKETEKQTGTGIGLVLSRSLAELHTGELVLKETADGMNTFSLCLPVHQEIEFDLSSPNADA